MIVLREHHARLGITKDVLRSLGGYGEGVGPHYTGLEEIVLVCTNQELYDIQKGFTAGSQYGLPELLKSRHPELEITNLAGQGNRSKVESKDVGRANPAISNPGQVDEVGLHERSTESRRHVDMDQAILIIVSSAQFPERKDQELTMLGDLKHREAKYELDLERISRSA